jgi:hypothetical protein
MAIGHFDAQLLITTKNISLATSLARAIFKKETANVND